MTDQELNAVPIKLELPLGAVNFVLAALAKAPYEQVADLVQAIREQATPQLPMPDMSNEVAQAPADAA
jgi:hypothetical protein